MSTKKGTILKTSGLNNYNQVGHTSNNKSGKYPIICPPLSSKIVVSNLISYSVYYHHASWVTKDGQGYAIGDNSYGAILGSLPKSKLETATEIDMKDSRGIQCKFISILCGHYYTLYLISRTDGIRELAYVYESKNDSEPLFLNIENRQPVSLYGGYSNSAAIDTEGAIIAITKSLFDSPLNPVKAATLPGGEKAVSVACCKEFYLALSESGRVFKSSSSELSFEEVEELRDKEIVDISGTFSHCFAVCSEGEVFVYGSISSGALCLGEGVSETDKFTKVASLEKYKITGASAGSSHSLFRTEDGKVLSCGGNSFGQLMLDRFDFNEKIYSPVETTIESGASFCIAGNTVSAVFVGEELPPNMPNRRLPKKNDHLTSRKTVSSSTKSEGSEYLKDKEISELKAGLEAKDRELSNQQAKMKEREKRETTIYKNHIRFLEERLLKYEKVQIFDINDTSTHRRPEIKPDDNGNDDDDDSDVELKKTKEGTHNIFIGEEDEEHHEVLKKIGEGATSVAYKIIDRRTSEVMCKKVVKNVEDEEAFNKLRNSLREFGALTSISHPSICGAIGMNTSEKVEESTSNKDSDYDYDDVDEDDDDDEKAKNSREKEKTTVALFLEYLPFKLKDVLKSDIMNDTLRVKICIEVAFGMKRLHQSGMIHRDLKIDNIMLNWILEAKIIDFDLVHIDDKDEGSLTKGVGTLDYMSPEMLNKGKYDNKTDVYSYGIVVFVLLTGRLPKQNLTDKMNKKPIKFPRHSSSLTAEGIELINKCTAFEPKDRPSFSEILEMIENKKFKLAKEVDRDIVLSRYQELNRFESLHQNKETKKPKK